MTNLLDKDPELLTETERELIAEREENRRLRAELDPGRDPKPYVYYKKLKDDRRKANPFDIQLLSAKEQEEMVADCMALGEEEFNRGWKDPDRPVQKRQRTLYVAGTSQEIN